MRREWWVPLLIAGIVVAVGIGLAVGVLAGNRSSPTPGLLPQADPSHPVRCTSIEQVAPDACSQGALDVRPPVLGSPCALPGGAGVWRAVGSDRVCRRPAGAGS